MSQLQFPEFKTLVSKRFPRILFGSCQFKIVSKQYDSSVFNATFDDRFIVQVRVFSFIEDQSWFIRFEDGVTLRAISLDGLMESVMIHIEAIADELIED